VAGRVRKQIEKDKVVGATENDQPLCVVCRVSVNAKDTRRRLTPARRQIIVAPRAPDEIHITDSLVLPETRMELTKQVLPRPR